MLMRFVLVHGGFHAAWCWERTIPELNRLGYDAVAVDVPGHGDRLHEESTLANRRDAIVAVYNQETSWSDTPAAVLISRWLPT